MSEFDMNQLLRSYVGDESEAGAEEASNEDESIGGKSDGGAGSERAGKGARDMNAWLRDAVSESRGRST